MRGLHKNIVLEARSFVSDSTLLVKRREKYERILKSLKERHSVCDRMIVDLMHEIEFSENYSVDEQMEFFSELKRVTELRRRIKDRIDFYRHVMLFYKRGESEEQFVILEKKIEATIKSKRNRKYKKRVKASEAV